MKFHFIIKYTINDTIVQILKQMSGTFLNRGEAIFWALFYVIYLACKLHYIFATSSFATTLYAK
ncbi:hypothetical protein MHB50_05710 [Siminovitchia sp. FSL H7-0308]|uniref:hypothetical protein n=1 Tax=Siminovitchia sp. FSL H7-0308 TaxID=2921432 RepID=UPI0030EC228D